MSEQFPASNSATRATTAFVDGSVKEAFVPAGAEAKIESGKLYLYDRTLTRWTHWVSSGKVLVRVED